MIVSNNLTFISLAPVIQSKNAEVQKLIDQAEALVQNEVSLKSLDAGLPLLEKANQLDPNNYDLMIELANFYWQRGDQMPKANDQDFEKRNVYFNKGKAYAEIALKMKESAGAYYWFTANLASSYQNKNALAQARLFPTLKKNTDWIDAHDPGYFYGGGARIWSKVVAEVPKVLLAMGLADPEDAYRSLNDAIKLEPRYLLNYTYKGNFLWSQGRKDEALKELDYVLKADPNIFPQELAKNKLAQKEARESWKQFTKKDWPQR